MTPHEKAYWLADKICIGGDYCKEAADILKRQADEIERLTIGDGWGAIDTAPLGKRFIACVPIEKHRLVIATKTIDGLILAENSMPMPYPPLWWHELPKRPVK